MSIITKFVVDHCYSVVPFTDSVVLSVIEDVTNTLMTAKPLKAIVGLLKRHREFISMSEPK